MTPPSSFSLGSGSESIMKISRDWLQDFIDLEGISDASLSETLTSIGHAVEAIEEHDGDTVLEIEFTANRLDAMSHRGVARELSAALGRPLADGLRAARPLDDGVRAARPLAPGRPAPSPPEAAGTEAIPITIDAPAMCNRYTGTLIRGVTIAPSDGRIQSRLQAVGLRPINNIVDITNYVMLETGHPLHAFDLDRLEGGEIIVRAARESETLETLDGVARKLETGDVVIADAARAVALGGVIGGANSEITDSTSDVLLECAHFDPVTIRLTARRLGISTDASYRFERGVDPGDSDEVSLMAAWMIAEIAGGRVEGMTDIVATPVDRLRVSLRKTRLDLFSGSAISLEEAAAFLDALGMEIERGPEALEVIVPSWRSDIEGEIDLVEEVLRLYGFDRIPSSLPRVSTGDVRREEPRDLGEQVRDLMRGFGLDEVISYSFIHPEESAAASEETPVPVVNALTENISVMRPSIIPGLLQILERNASYGTRDGGIFEVGRTYHAGGEVFDERETLAFLLFGSPDPASKRQADYLDAKGIVEELASRLRTPVEFRRADRPWLRESQGAEVIARGEVAGVVGVVRTEHLRSRGYRGSAIGGELRLSPFIGSQAGWKMTPVSRYPGVPMVAAFVHGPELAWEELHGKAASFDTPHLREVGLWDRFQPEESDTIKTTLAMWYQSEDRSLTQEEIAQIHQELTRKITEALPVEPV
jgi:phenylalanyl-tRNA synthetase beta chain